MTLLRDWTPSMPCQDQAKLEWRYACEMNQEIAEGMLSPFLGCVSWEPTSFSC